MGLFGKGFLSVSVLRISTGATLDELASAMADRIYTNAGESSQSGWGSIEDGIESGERTPSSVPFSPTAPRVEDGRHGFSMLGARFYYDVTNKSILDRLGKQSDWRLFSDRFGVDLLVVADQNGDGHTVLVASRKRDEVDGLIRPALREVVESVDSTGLIKSIAIAEEHDPDFFLWLLHRSFNRISPADDIVLNAIDRVQAHQQSGWVTNFTQGTSPDREDLLVNISKQADFGKLKVGLDHAVDPEGHFEVLLERDGGFSAYRACEYEEENLNKLPPDLLGRRIVEDLWYVVLPKMRDVYNDDKVWRDKTRGDFIVWARTELEMRYGGGTPAT
ncbi:hypothetical protein LRS71_09575 [Rhodococcus pyridinivorans]|uniref:hypothetical protein n=1 Tax=Rhodococcus pyridinivorans TaxID=103816 RepID=UPI001E62E1E1|nr:hypothetical protein [Rhodococcus pyridinivorans]MCD5419803.1 hypothetical protein [Rhodococcus pyridinivorans]